MRSPFFDPGVSYTATSEWARRLDGGNIRVGIDDYSQSALGDVVFVDLPQTGARLRAGSPFGSLEATKAVSDLNAPVSGRVVRVNEALQSSPGLVNADPFGEGWMVELEPDNGAEFNSLMGVDAYKEYLRGQR